MTHFLSLIAIIAFNIDAVLGHGYVTSINVAGKDYEGSDPYGDSNASIMWSATDGANPVTNLSSDAITCNQGAEPAQLYAAASPGDQVVFDWTKYWVHTTGLVVTYMADCKSNCTTVVPQTLDWFKIDEAGYYPTTKLWALSKYISQGDTWTVTIPSNLKAGNYLIRHELINLEGKGKSWPACINVQLGGSGTDYPTSEYFAKFPGTYNPDDAAFQQIGVGISSLKSYTLPGPEIWNSSTSASSTSDATTTLSPLVATGLASTLSSVASAATSSGIGSAVNKLLSGL